MGDHDHSECEQAVKAVYEYLDGQMESGDQVTITTHLRGCQGCADAVEFERIFLLKIRKACGCGADMPPALVGRVQQLLRRAAEENC